ncbi:MAG: FtsX-like permease family protein [Nitrospirae bacterium]|nr:FtsX-like permease family protein [Nitrospirota bacterium]
MKTMGILTVATANLLRHRLRTFVVVICLVVIITPFVSALALLEGIKKEAMISVQEGADLYVTMDMYGRNGMIPMEVADEIKKINGVLKAVPRVISRIYVEGRLCVLLGIPLDEIEETVKIIKGELPDDGEIVVGRALAKALGLEVGSNLSLGVRVTAIIDHSPFIMKRVYRVSGIFDTDTSIWSSDLILTGIDDAISIYEMEDFVSDIAVYVAPSRLQDVADTIQQMNAYFRIQSKSIAKQYVKRGFNRKGGIFVLLYTFAFILAIPVMLIVSGTGLTERKKEMAILKATGWQTDEVLQMAFFENTIIALISAPASVLISYIWLKLFNGAFIAQMFIAEIENIAPFRIPVQFTFGTFLMAIFFSLIFTLVGSIYSTWRTATTPPAEVLR